MATKPLYSFPARMESLPAMLQHVRQMAGMAPEDVVLRTETAVEELLTNSVVHGRAAASPGSEVWISVSAHGGALYLCYEDALAPFDPTGKIAEALAHLASDAASTTTGASLVVDNGTLWS